MGEGADSRAKAIKKVRKLRELADPDRGGTDGERENATEKAQAIVARFSLSEDEIAGPFRPPAAVDGLASDVMAHVFRDYGFTFGNVFRFGSVYANNSAVRPATPEEYRQWGGGFSNAGAARVVVEEDFD